ncbi:MAG: phytase [bacterium]
MKINYVLKIPLFVSISIILTSLFVSNCTKKNSDNEHDSESVSPVVVTDTVKKDSDDPAIWIHPTDPSKSLILGTDKAGILFVFNLDGKIINSASGKGMLRLNNVDVEYGMMLGGKKTDIAVTTDRDAKKIYVLSVPALKRIDGGGIEAFEGEEFRRPMGIAIYKRPKDGAFFAMVSRKQGPSRGYLWQYKLEDDGTGNVKFTKVREFGEWSGKNKDGEGEIEAVVVDDELGYVYYSDELFGIRKYHADPDIPDANQELAVFGRDGFVGDREGISIYKIDDGTGYIIVSDQQANKFRIFTREGTSDNPHHHELVKVVHASTNKSDGSEVTNVKLNETFPNGLFVAMSDDKTFQFYSWADIAGDDLVVASNGIK